MRADDRARAVPERVILGQWFGVGHVERRAETSGLEFRDEGVGVDDLAAPGVDDQSAVRECREERRVNRAARLLVQRCGTNADRAGLDRLNSGFEGPGFAGGSRAAEDGE